MRTSALALQKKVKSNLSPEMALELASGDGFGCNRHCKTNADDLEGSRGQVLKVLGVVVGGFWRRQGAAYAGRESNA